MKKVQVKMKNEDPVKGLLVKDQGLILKGQLGLKRK